MEFKVKVEKTSNILRKFAVCISAATVGEHLERKYLEIQKTAKMKGFRPGFVPLAIVKQTYGEDIKHRIFHELIEESLSQAIDNEKLKVVGSPKIEELGKKEGQAEHDHHFQEGSDLNYVATVEIMPEVEIKNYLGISLKKEKTEVTDNDVENVITGLQNSKAEFSPASGGLLLADGSNSSRSLRNKDHVELSYIGKLVTENGLQDFDGLNGKQRVEIGAQGLIPGFEDELVGMNRGETRTFRLQFPKDYHAKEVAGKEAEFTVTVHEISEKKLPDLNDEFAKQMGYESVLDLRVKARDFVSKEKLRQADQKIRSEILKHLLEKNKFEVPMALIQSQVRHLAQTLAHDLKEDGLKEEEIKKHLEESLPTLAKKAEIQVKASLLLESIANKEKITVEPTEVNQEIKTMATSMKLDEEHLKNYYNEEPARLENLAYRLMEDKTFHFLIEKANLTEG